MGRDASPPVRQKAQLARRRGVRAPHDRILIVSEGSKTEPNYFREIRSTYRLAATSVAVRPSEWGTAPIQVVQYAQALFQHGDRHRRIQQRAFERVYAVFDRDDHLSYRDALALAASLDGQLRNDTRQRVTFKAVASIPCFELWLLLHFEEVHAPLHRDEVLRRLKRHIPGYSKGWPDAFAVTHQHLMKAMARAQRLAQQFSAMTEPQPFTDVASLVALLTTLRP